jgi:hypothetical protein
MLDRPQKQRGRTAGDPTQLPPGLPGPGGAGLFGPPVCLRGPYEVVDPGLPHLRLVHLRLPSSAARRYRSWPWLSVQGVTPAVVTFDSPEA